ncbi:chemosensory receptor A [Elysia marginata]|uniref:Chemosensory receptor A n=1 Tax=Elysia marginata TaxID=1093978 RepID=A0AAV4JPA8_9GAST|nr:chemosensory receptor A [Elysia marginata]
MSAGVSLNRINFTTIETSRSTLSPRQLGLSNELFLPLLNVTLVLDVVVALFAILANIVTISVYRKLGYADSSNVSLTALAVSDLAVSLTTITCVLAIVLPDVIPNAPFTHGIFVFISSNPHVNSTRVSALITAFISLERYLCVLVPLRVKSLITPKRTFKAMVVIFAIGHIGWFFDFAVYSIRWEFIPGLNRTVLNTVPAKHVTAVALRGFSQTYYSFFLPVLTFSIVLICTFLLSASLHRNKEWRDANKRTSSNNAPANRGADDPPSPTTESATPKSKEAKAIKMVITISTVFIIATIPASIHMVAVVFVPGFDFGGRYVNLWILTGMTFLIIDCINCSANVMIYYNMSSKFRTATRELFLGKGGISGNRLRK